MNAFVWIEHISDILPHIEGRKEFVVKERDGYTAIDYNYAEYDTFDNEYRRECRGIKFDSMGNLIARPYHKFFNLNEKPETQLDKIQWNSPHQVMEKLDGSMVHPAEVNGKIVWMTRAGITDISEEAGKYADISGETDKVAALLDEDMTPIFEWTSPDNQIVLKYPRPRLTLTAIRHNHTGEYFNVGNWQGYYDLPTFHEFRPATHVISHARELKGEEGYVLRWMKTGFMIKIKADEYVLRHRARDDLLNEKNVLQMVLSKKIDDILPMLSEEDQQRLQEYHSTVINAIFTHCKNIRFMVKAAKKLGVDRKGFAVNYASTLDPVLRAAAFKAWEGENVAATILKSLLTYCTSQPDVDKIRHLIGGVKWNW